MDTTEIKQVTDSKAKRILIITAHPSTKGHTHEIAQVYKEESEKKGHTVEVLDLYSVGNELPFLRFEDIKSYEMHPNVVRFQQTITNSNEIVFVHPLWWGGAPAIMKNFLDQVFCAGFAFAYPKGKQTGLLKGRTAKVFLTCGGPMWLYRVFVIPPFKAIWKYITLEFCGLKLTDFIVSDKMSMHMKPERYNKFLEKVRKSADK
jgi:putative NADPH-quinone reductase